MLKPPIVPEDALHVAVLHLLRVALPSEACAFHVPNGGARTPQAGAAMKRLGTLPGMPDLILLWRGKSFGLELKTSVGRRSKVQIACHTRLMAAGMPVATCHSVEDVVSALGAWGIPLRVTLAA